MTDHEEMAALLAEVKNDLDEIPNVVADRVEAAITLHEEHRHHTEMPLGPGETAQSLMNTFRNAVKEIPGIKTDVRQIKDNQGRIFEAIEGTPIMGLNGTVIGHEGGLRPRLGVKFWFQVVGATAAAFTMMTALFALLESL